MEKVENVISNVSDEELEELSGGVGCGWICTFTLDCPGTRWFNCC